MLKSKWKSIMTVVFLCTILGACSFQNSQEYSDMIVNEVRQDTKEQEQAAPSNSHESEREEPTATAGLTPETEGRTEGTLGEDVKPAEKKQTTIFADVKWYFTPEEMVEEADRIISGTIIKTEYEWRSFLAQPLATGEDLLSLYTVYTVRVDDSYKGEMPESGLLSVYTQGGETETEIITIEDTPTLDNDTKYVFFLRDSQRYEQTCVIMACGLQSVYVLADDRVYPINDTGFPLTLEWLESLKTSTKRTLSLYEKSYQAANEEQKRALEALHPELDRELVSCYVREIQTIMGVLPSEAPRATRENAEQIAGEVDASYFKDTKAFEDYASLCFKEFGVLPDYVGGEPRRILFYCTESEEEYIEISSGEIRYTDQSGTTLLYPRE